MEHAVETGLGGLMGLLILAIIGLVIGAVAKALTPGPDPGGWFATILLGIAGSWVGAFFAGAARHRAGTGDGPRLRGPGLDPTAADLPHGQASRLIGRRSRSRLQPVISNVTP